MLETLVIIVIFLVIAYLVYRLPSRRERILIHKPRRPKLIEGRGEKGLSQEGNFYKRANEFLNNGDLNQAEKYYIKAITQNPKDCRSYNELGVVYLKEKNFPDAINCFKQAIEIDKGNAVFYNNLGLAYHRQGKYKKAISEFKKSIALDPKPSRRYINLGLAYMKLGNFQKAKENFDRALKIDPDNIEYLTLFAQTLLKLGDEDLAKIILKRILKLDPENIEAKRELLRLQ